jgi:hypothetical protein
VVAIMVQIQEDTMHSVMEPCFIGSQASSQFISGDLRASMSIDAVIGSVWAVI